MASREKRAFRLPPTAVRWLLVAGLLSSAWGAAGLGRRVVFGSFLRERAQAALSQMTSATLDHLGGVTLDLDGNLVVRDVSVSLVEGDVRRPLWKARRAVLSLDGWPLRDADLRLTRVDLYGAEVHFRRDRHGMWNLKRVLQKPPRPSPTPSPPPSPSPSPSVSPSPPSSSPRDPFPPRGVHLHDADVHLALEGSSGREAYVTATGVHLQVHKGEDGIRLSPIRGRVYGGALRAQVAIHSTVPLSVSAQVDVAQADLSMLVAGNPGVVRPVTGRLDGVLSVRLGPETGWRAVAAGRVEISEGTLYELPAFTGLLGLLALDPVPDRKIDSAQILFTVDRTYIRIDEMNFLGRPVSLFGDGVMGLAGEDLYIVLVPRLGASWNAIVPIIGAPVQALLDVVKGELVPVVIGGSFWKPTFEIAPEDRGVSPRIRKLIEEKSRRTK